jgi:hypothetical protein
MKTRTSVKAGPMTVHCYLECNGTQIEDFIPVVPGS